MLGVTPLPSTTLSATEFVVPTAQVPTAFLLKALFWVLEEITPRVSRQKFVWVRASAAPILRRATSTQRRQLMTVLAISRRAWDAPTWKRATTIPTPLSTTVLACCRIQSTDAQRPVTSRWN